MCARLQCVRALLLESSASCFVFSYPELPTHQSSALCHLSLSHSASPHPFVPVCLHFHWVPARFSHPPAQHQLIRTSKYAFNCTTKKPSGRFLALAVNMLPELSLCFHLWLSSLCLGPRLLKPWQYVPVFDLQYIGMKDTLTVAYLMTTPWLGL